MQSSAPQDRQGIDHYCEIHVVSCSNNYELKNKVRLGLVGMKIPTTYFEQVTLGQVRPFQIRQKHSEKIANSLIDSVKVACNEDANVICCSEYSFPFLCRKELSIRLSNLAREKHCYIFAGSYVAMDSDVPHYNTCPVFTPDRIIPIPQYKMRSGWVGGKPEDIEVSPRQETVVFSTEYGIIAILICIDIQNRNARYNFKQMNRLGSLYKSVDILLVPSYTSEPMKLHGYCQDTSSESNICVAYVNDLFTGSHPKVYVNGEDKPCTPVKTSETQGTVSIYDLDLAKMRRHRSEGMSQSDL